MSRKLLTSLFAICASVAVVAAQTPAPAPAPQAPATQAPAAPAAPAAQAAKAPSLTVEGCVEKSAMAPTGTSGATGTAGAAGGSFILANAARPKDAPAAASSGTIASSYRLDATDSQLSPHVGHRVAITGTVESPAAGAATPPAAGAASAAAPRLKVESVKMIAATCTP